MGISPEYVSWIGRSFRDVEIAKSPLIIIMTLEYSFWRIFPLTINSYVQLSRDLKSDDTKVKSSVLPYSLTTSRLL